MSERSEAASNAYQPTPLEAAAFPHLDMTCWCWTCDDAAIQALPEGDIRRLGRRMNLCPTCGNKRCPRSTDHTLACTGSNDPGQAGSRYPAPPCRYCGHDLSTHNGPYCMEPPTQAAASGTQSPTVSGS